MSNGVYSGQPAQIQLLAGGGSGGAGGSGSTPASPNPALTRADAHRIVNDVLNNRRPWSDLRQLSPQQLQFEIDIYRRTAQLPLSQALPADLVRDFNNSRIDFLRTGVGRGPGSIWQYAEQWLQRQSQEWLQAHAQEVAQIRRDIQVWRELMQARGVVNPGFAARARSWVGRTVRIGGRVLGTAAIGGAIAANILGAIRNVQRAIPPIQWRTPEGRRTRATYDRLIRSFPAGDFRDSISEFLNLTLWRADALVNGLGADANAAADAVIQNIVMFFSNNPDELVRLAWIPMLPHVNSSS